MTRRAYDHDSPAIVHANDTNVAAVMFPVRENAHDSRVATMMIVPVVISILAAERKGRTREQGQR
jgi:hypothetical protein